jgi:hypothetical protein
VSFDGESHPNCEEIAKLRSETAAWRDAVMACDRKEKALRAERDALLKAAQAGRDLMAVIHCDDGAYRERHGDRKAADDAIEVVGKLRAEIGRIDYQRVDYANRAGDLTGERDRLRELLTCICDRYADYRAAGVAPAPGRYQKLVLAIEKATAALKEAP